MQYRPLQAPAWKIVTAILAATLALAVAPATAAAPTACYEVRAADTNRSLDTFVRVVTQPVAVLDGPGPRQRMDEVHGKLTKRTGEIRNGRPVVEMDLLTGSLIIVAGKGTQMSILRNFGRGSETLTGFSILDCGARGSSPVPGQWICRGITGSSDAAVPRGVVSARGLILRKVPINTPQCADYEIRAD